MKKITQFDLFLVILFRPQIAISLQLTDVFDCVQRKLPVFGQKKKILFRCILGRFYFGGLKSESVVFSKSFRMSSTVGIFQQRSYQFL